MSEIPEGTFISAIEDPARANQAVQALMADAAPQMPTIPAPADDQLDLPGGVITSDGRVLRTAVVRELTGADEEALARAQVSGSFARMMTTMLTCGTVRVGELYPTTELLEGLLTGDRDALFLAIRIATYGPELDTSGQCPHCGGTFEITIRLDELPIRSLRDPVADRSFTVPLRRGGTALVRLPTGADVTRAWEDSGLTDAERNTLLLAACVISITGTDGAETPVAGQTAEVRELGLADRRTILTELGRAEPGPQWRDGVRFTHDRCGQEVTWAASAADLFRDL